MRYITFLRKRMMGAGFSLLMAASSGIAGYSQVVESDIVDASGIRCVRVTIQGVCAKAIDIKLLGQTLKSVVYTKGCSGNAKAVGSLVEGMNIDEVIRRLENITCGSKSSSCPDQLAKSLKLIKQKRPDKAIK